MDLILLQQILLTLQQPCHYCGNKRSATACHKDFGRPMNADNVVGACASCNFIKYAQHIVTHLDNPLLDCSMYPYMHKMQTFREWKESHQQTVEIDESEYLALINKACTYCGKASASGIALIDILNGYTLVNCLPCCNDCNKLKKDLTHSFFVAHMRRIVTYQSSKKSE